MADNSDDSVLAQVARDLLAKPETRERFQRMVKEAHPENYIPEIDVADKVRSGFDSEMKALKDEVFAMRAERDIGARRDGLVKAGLATREEIPEVEALMQSRSIGDYEAAAQLLRVQKQAARPAPTYQERKVNMPTNDKDLMSNPRDWALSEAYRAFHEMSH